MNSLLLSDENNISSEDLDIRKQLYLKFIELPKEFISKMRHLQPQIGCFNNCSFCSKSSACKSEYWNERSLRNVIASLKAFASNHTKGDLLAAWDRSEHRIGVLFPYVDNDIGAYAYLDKYIELCYKELGAKTRLSTVGFSRHNKQLVELHKRINSSELIYALAGVRLSLTQYGRVWEEKSNNHNIEEYEKDIINFLETYRPYYEKFGSGPRKMCVELRYNPLVKSASVIETEINGNKVIATGNYLFISKNEQSKMNTSYIVDPYIHALELSEGPVVFNEYNLPFVVEEKDKLVEYINNNDLDFEKSVDVYKFKNKDGYYYAIEPKIKNTGNYGFNIYPKTDIRKKSGYLITERFLLNSIYQFKKEVGLNLRSIYTNSTWKDVDKVIDKLEQQVAYYQNKNKLDKVKYIKENVLPLVKIYINALKEASYNSDCFFDAKFTIDTGVICNLGRAFNLFSDITNYVNEPLTPSHERNYGRYCSTMKQENSVWLLGCGYDSTINIERLDLFKTASPEGQKSYKEVIKIENFNVKENGKFVYPGIKE